MAGVLVGEVVEEIAVAGDEAVVCGVGVVGTEGGGGVGVGVEGLAGGDEEVRGDADVGVDEEEEMAGGGGGTGVAGGGDPGCVGELDGLEAAGGGGGVDGGIGAVDGDDDLARGRVECGEGVEAGDQDRAAAVGGDDDADTGGFVHPGCGSGWRA